MKTKIRCPFHQDDTASLVKYSEGWHCFGACRRRYTNEEVAAKGISTDYEDAYEEPEDIEETFRYIDSLPKRRYRGLELPTDERGSFICWPGRSYYKYRVHHPGKGSKYLGPRGRKPPLFCPQENGGSTLLIVEGEINALSVAQAFPEWDVCSPGSASNFNKKLLGSHLTQFAKYASLIVLVDSDEAGILALIETKAFFLYKIPFISYIRLETDCNEILCEFGTEALRKEISCALQERV